MAIVLLCHCQKILSLLSPSGTTAQLGEIIWDCHVVMQRVNRARYKITICLWIYKRGHFKTELLSSSALKPTPLIVFNLLECSNLKSVKWKHISLELQEFYKCTGTPSNRQPLLPNPSSSFSK